MQKVAVVCLCMTALAAAGCRTEDPLARARHDAAEFHARAARDALGFDPVRAVIAARLAAQSDPLDPSYVELYLRARAQEALALGAELPRSRFAEAQYEAWTGERRDPEFRHVYVGVACLVVLATGDPATAERDLLEAMKGHEDWAAGQALLGRIYEARRKPDEALAAYSKALELDTSARAPYLPAARLMLTRGDFTRAAKTLEAALPHDGGPAVRIALAEAYDGVSRFNDATAQLAKAVELDPRHAQARMNYAEHLTREGRFVEADAEYVAAGRLGAEPLATRGRGLVAWAQRDAARASAAFAQVLQLVPEDTTTLFYAAEAAEALKKPAEAAALYEKYVTAAAAFPAESDRVATARERVLRLKGK